MGETVSPAAPRAASFNAAPRPAHASESSTRSWRPAVPMLCLALGSALLAGAAPLGFSVVTVFLFAGPHNWMESRYFLSRMPARWGPLREFFQTGILGVACLTGLFCALPWIADRWANSASGWHTTVAAWNTLLTLWVMRLVQLRCRHNPRREWSWVYPLGFSLVAITWLVPQAWDLALVYLHPLVALWFLDREIGLHRPGWRTAYRVSLCAVPALLAGLWWHLGNAPNLPGSDALSLRITQHAGADILRGVSSHALVATHTFLEMLHYGAWLVAIPLVGLRQRPWRAATIPLARRSSAWRLAIVAILVCGALAVIGFWAGFLADYPLTRDVYFTVAMAHVLAEVPFLLRLL